MPSKSRPRYRLFTFYTNPAYVAVPALASERKWKLAVAAFVTAPLWERMLPCAVCGWERVWHSIFLGRCRVEVVR